MIELVAMDAQGIMGSWFSARFFIGGSPTDVGPEALPTVYSVRSFGANPVTNGKATLELARQQEGPVHVRGALVRDLVSSVHMPAGRHTIDWDGTSRAGQPVSAGVYFVHARAGEQDLKSRFTLLR